MFNNFLLAAAASAMLLTAPVLVEASTTHAIQSATTAKTKTGSTKAAPTKTASTKATPSKIASAKTMSHEIAITKATHHHHAKMAKNVSVQGDREVRALNALESAGYRQFNNLRANGTDFVATAMKAGRSYDVTVTPQGRIEAKKA